MYYDIAELLSLTQKPKINDISLKLLSTYYEDVLSPYGFIYEISDTNNSNSSSVVNLRFDIDKFCHLIGVESVAKSGSVARKSLHNYRGLDGWQNIKNDVIDIQHLKQLNKKKFNSIKAKCVYFYLLKSLVENPLAVRYNKNDSILPTNIDCELLFYSSVKNDNAIIHLGIEKGNKGYYFPKTFFVEKVSEKEKDDYLKGQKDVKVRLVKKEKIST